VENHQRVYIPLVGLEGKMEVFKEDTQINIWRLLPRVDKSMIFKEWTINVEYFSEILHSMRRQNTYSGCLTN